MGFKVFPERVEILSKDLNENIRHDIERYI